MAIVDTPVRSSLDLGPEVPPLRAWPDGTVRLGTSRVLLELVINAYNAGDTPEAIAMKYTSAGLPEIYGAIAYYLRHREALDAYVAAYEAGAIAIREKIEASQRDMSHIRARIEAAREASNRNRG